MRRCRIGIVPISRRCGPEKRQFASPLKLIEWMAAGVPVIASDVPSVAARVAHEGQALLASADDPSALAAAMRRLTADEPLRRRLRDAGLPLAVESTFERRAQRIVAFVERLQR